MHKLLLLIFLCFTSLTFAQTTVVTGRCIDKRGKTLPNVLVSAKNSVNQDLNLTDKNGRFEISFFNQFGTMLYFELDMKDRLKYPVSFNKEDTIDIGDFRFPYQVEGPVVVNHAVENPLELDKLEYVDLQLIPMSGGVERLLALTTAASSNNELTSNYNVRGGSYDENLVYVNGFNIYRPFLTRSGQQEGMSFINSALVSSIQFSGGGFSAEYGDKLSSVLDITYKTPGGKNKKDSLEGSVMASLMGVEAHIGHAVSNRLNYLVGARYRSNGYLLNSLPTKGSYNPVFWDAQVLVNYKITERLTWSTIGHFSSNDYRFAPETARTDFGTANEAYSFTIYFDGEEKTRFQTMMGGTALKYETVDQKSHLELYATVFNTDERESFDIQGQYFINELETDPSKEEFGDSIAVLGVGTFLNHARNRLNATIINVYHHGDHQLNKGYKDDERLKFRSNVLKWGVNFQMDDFQDVLSEWRMIDSAGYSVAPEETPPNEIQLFETIKGKLSLRSQRYTSFVQLNSIWSKNKLNHSVEVTKKYKNKLGVKEKVTFRDTIRESRSKLAMSFGLRGVYTSANDDFYLTPRATLKYFPRVYMVDDSVVKRRDVVFKVATGLYYQPPFYREFRTFEGGLNMNVLSQKSLHIVTGTDVYFNMWDREVPFKFTAEAYYKYLWNVNPYEIDNVRTRYFANNDAVGYAYGLDLNIHGQFVPGIESFFKVGFLNTKEDVLTDQFTEYYNEAGDKIIFGISEDQTVVDSAIIEPGYIPRPTDQWMNFGALIQDRMPKYESISVQVGIQFGSRLPYGPPDLNRYRDTLRMKSYFRVDFGTSYDFLYRHKQKVAAQELRKLKNAGTDPINEEIQESFWSRRFTDAIISFEVFNLLGINNVLSKQWIQDTQGVYYSIPNYLTQRRFNLKLILRF